MFNRFASVSAAVHTTLRPSVYKFITLALGLAATLVLSGCAATGAPFTSIAALPEGQAQLYLYRKFAHQGALDAFTVQLDKSPAGDLFNSSFMVIPLTPGEHTITVQPGAFFKTYEHTVKIAANQTQYLEFEVAGNILRLGSELTPRDAEQAKADLKQLKAVK